MQAFFRRPLLIDEEELTEDEISTLQRDQLQKERDAITTVEKSAAARAAIVRQLIKENTGSEHLSEETLKKLQRKWAKYSLTADENNAADEWQDEDDFESASTEPYPDEQSELITWDDLDGPEMVIPGAEKASEDPSKQNALQFVGDDYEEEDIQLVKPTDGTRAAGSWHTGRGNADDAGDIEKKGLLDIEELPRPGKDAKFIDVLATCKTLSCLRDAHTRTRDPGQQFNFPHALLIGWQKSATTSLFAHLERHPQVLASKEKEPEFFTIKCTDNPFSGCPRTEQAWYIENTIQRDNFVKSKGKLMAFEASTHYAMNGDLLAKGIAETLPWVKIVASLREPISRATSMLVHMADKEANGCLANGNTDIYTCLTTESQLIGNHGPFNLVDSPHGNYSYALRHWLEAFPRGRVHIMQYEELIAEDRRSEDVLHDLKLFLGVDPGEPGPSPYGRILDKHNLRKDHLNPDGWPIKKEKYLKLIDMVKEDAEKYVIFVVIIVVYNSYAQV